MTDNDDLIAIFTLTAMTIVSVVYDINIARQVLGIVFILFCPGYALIAALFAKSKDLEPIERIALSFGLSIAIVPLIGLGLNYTEWGISMTPILVSNTSFTFAVLMAAFFRRRAVDEGSRFAFNFEMPKVELGEGRMDRALSIVLIISILVSVGALVYVVQAPKQGESFTEFYILGPGGMADDYPTEFALGESKPVIMGIVNHEHATVDYVAEINLDGTVLWSKEYTIADGTTMEEGVQLEPDRVGDDMKLQFLLYVDGEVYRDLHLWISVVQ